jgi:hypothetical protein
MLQCMRNRWGQCLVALGLAMVVSVATAAAQEIDANIAGRVVDDGGGVLPGVTVTATSPALQVPSVSTVTNASGDYRLSPLPIGTYDVTYELPGFTSARRGFGSPSDSPLVAQLRVGGVRSHHGVGARSSASRRHPRRIPSRVSRSNSSPPLEVA